MSSRSKMNSKLRSDFIMNLEKSVETIKTDRRDVWEKNMKVYSKGKLLSNGSFGMVWAALGQDCNYHAPNASPPACVMKVSFLGRKIDKIFEDYKDDNTEIRARLDQLAKRTMTEMFILNRFRHRHILHSHCVSAHAGDLTLVLPRLYCLEDLIVQFRKKMNGESIPADIIMKIVRQICMALKFLHEGGIYHRTIQADHIYLTRSGTVKLAHFGAVNMELDNDCVTPVGKREYMSLEKQFNLCVAESRKECRQYDGAADVWALGILVLRMVSYFPQEKWQKLPIDFVMTMKREEMPFKWVIAEMTQLRVRLRKCAGEEDLRSWLSDKVLTVDPRRRATPAELLETSALKNLCNEDWEKDRDYLLHKLCELVDWPNRDKLEADRLNYDGLEAKDIPADFYWDEHESWKLIEKAEVEFQLQVSNEADEKKFMSGSFVFKYVHKLLATLGKFVNEGSLSWFDILAVDHFLREMTFNALRNYLEQDHVKKTEVQFSLPDTSTYKGRRAIVGVRILSFVE